jgi:hypothetical protein
MHMTPDMINACFEGLGSIMIWDHVRKAYKDKKVGSVSIPATLFFFSWGVWNCVYYPWISQLYSFYAGIALALGNLVWVVQLIYYSRKNKGVTHV